MPVEGRDLTSKPVIAKWTARRLTMSLPPPATVEKLQAALHTKAKETPTYRFYALYDKVYRSDVLSYAYERCRANDGAAGVDGQTFADIAEYGVAKWLAELAQDLKGKTYHPQAVRRVWIPKGDGKRRPLGIPTVRDRVVQMAVVLVLEPIFEADLQPEQYAYRAGRDAHGAVQAVQQLLDQGYTEIVDADLSGYFDGIPHTELMKSVARRVSDRHLLHLRRFVLGWKQGGHAQRLDAHIVNYADDFVICCKPGRADEAMQVMREMMEKLRLTVNEKKTRQCTIPEEPFTFLGFTFGLHHSWKTGRAYVAASPSRKKVQA